MSLNMIFIITPINPSWMFGAIFHQHLFSLVSCSVEAIMIIFCFDFGVHVDSHYSSESLFACIFYT